MTLSAHQSARMKSDEWLTPPDILRALGDFDLDPCAPAVRPWPTAKLHYCKADDGLARPWLGRVWLNPPFGREAVKWLQKLVAHGDGIALWAARTETAAFQDLVWGGGACRSLPARPAAFPYRRRQAGTLQQRRPHRPHCLRHPQCARPGALRTRRASRASPVLLAGREHAEGCINV